MIDQPFLDAGLTQGVLSRRVWAWIVDALAIAVLAALLWVGFVVLGAITLGLGWLLLVLIPFVPLGYHILFVAGPQHATPGQALMGLQVLRDVDLGPPSLLQSILFTGGLWITLSVGFWPLLAALFTLRNRALHDIVANVVVVRRESLTRPPGFANMAAR